MAETMVLVTGGFDPIHSGHIAYLKSARMLGDRLIVGVNSDEWLIQKKGSAFLPLNERIEIVSNLSVVDEVIKFEDDEYNSAANAITTILEKYPNHKIIFANGGDRNSKNIPEMKIHGENPNIHFEFSVGGDFKKNSSSWILKNLDDKNINLKVNESIYIPTGSKHRLENKLNDSLHIIEIQTGSYFGEDDIQRYKDDYNRA